jgi:hypothetical protein
MAKTRGVLLLTVSKTSLLKRTFKPRIRGRNKGLKTAQTEATCKNHEHEYYKCVVSLFMRTYLQPQNYGSKWDGQTVRQKDEWSRKIVPC